MILLSGLYKSTGSCCCPYMGVSFGVGVTLQRFITKFFYIVGKALSDELSCMQTGLVSFVQMKILVQMLK